MNGLYGRPKMHYPAVGMAAGMHGAAEVFLTDIQKMQRLLRYNIEVRLSMDNQESCWFNIEESWFTVQESWFSIETFWFSIETFWFSNTKQANTDAMPKKTWVRWL